MSFVHLHNHTRFSLLDGMIRVEDLVGHAEKNGKAIAITDHGWLGGAAKFAHLAAEHDVKAIIGMEAYVVDDASLKTSENREWWHLILLAKTEEGYRNLSRLSSLGHSVGFYYKPRLDHKMLQEHSTGLIILSGCIGSEVPQKFCAGDEKAAIAAMKWHQQIFGDRYFVEIQDHGGLVEHIREPKNEGEAPVTVRERDLNAFLHYYADKFGIGMVATNDAHYLERKHGETHDTMLAMQTGTWKGAGQGRLQFPGARDGHFDFFLKSEKEMRAVSKEKWWQTACSNTAILADSVEKQVVKFGKSKLPPFKIPQDPEYVAWRKHQKLITI